MRTMRRWQASSPSTRCRGAAAPQATTAPSGPPCSASFSATAGEMVAGLSLRHVLAAGPYGGTRRARTHAGHGTVCPYPSSDLPTSPWAPRTSPPYRSAPSSMRPMRRCNGSSAPGRPMRKRTGRQPSACLDVDLPLQPGDLGVELCDLIAEGCQAHAPAPAASAASTADGRRTCATLRGYDIEDYADV